MNETIEISSQLLAVRRDAQSISEAVSTLLRKFDREREPHEADDVDASKRVAETDTIQSQSKQARGRTDSNERDKRLIRLAAQQTVWSEIANLDDVINKAESEGIQLSKERLKQVLKSDGGFFFLDEDHFIEMGTWEMGGKVNKLVERLLCVGPCGFESLYEGIANVYRGLRKNKSNTHVLPPAAAMLKYLEFNQCIEIDDEQIGRALFPLCRDGRLTQIEQALITFVHGRSKFEFSRDELRSACLRQGIKSPVFEAYMTYGLLFKRLAPNRWALRCDVGATQN